LKFRELFWIINLLIHTLELSRASYAKSAR